MEHPTHIEPPSPSGTLTPCPGARTCSPRPEPPRGSRPGAARRGPTRSTTLALLAAALFAVRCDAGESQNSGGPDPGDPACSGTTGELGMARFVFEENAWENLSVEGTRAFATGTRIGFRAEPAEGDDPLPDHEATSSDPTIFTAQTTQDPRFPHELTFVSAGTASVALTTTPGGDLLDRVTLRVRDPESIGLWVAPLDAEPIYVGGFAEEPARLLLYPAGGARLVFLLQDSAGDALIGNWDPAIEASAALLALPEGRLSVGEEAWVSAHTVALLGPGVGAEPGPAPGPEPLTLRGPGGVTRSVEVQLDATPLLADMTLAPSFSYDAEPDAADPLVDPTARAVVPAGTSGALSAIGWTAAGDPAFGYPVRYLSSNPMVASLTSQASGADSIYVRFDAPGEVMLTAILRDQPTVRRQLRILVVSDGP